MMPASEIMSDFKKGTLHSGKNGPIVKSKKQAKAIQLSYLRKEGKHIPNYVSREELHVLSGAGSAMRKGGAAVPYKTVNGSNGAVTAAPEVVGHSQDSPNGFGPSYEASVDTVAPVTRTQNHMEAMRQKNNRSRDMRTNLGRGKPASPVVD